LAWDPIARRWTSVFDASKQNPPSGFVRYSPDSQHPILPDLSVSQLQTAPIAGQPERGSDLFFSAVLSAGAGSGLIAVIVHYADQVAQVTWYFAAGAYGTMSVVGEPGAQHVSGAVQYLTPVDSNGGGVSQLRSYHIVFAQRQGRWTDVTDDRPWIGVTGVEQQVQGVTQLFVASVAPNSPLIGQLLPGDEIIGLSGEPPPPSFGALGPAVVDSIAKHRPGDTVGLQVLRNGQLRNVPVTLKSVIDGGPDVLAGADGYLSAAPAPGYLGVQVADAPGGVAVESAVSSGPADTAGIVVGDTITAVGGSAVTSSSTFSVLLASHAPGTSLDVALLDNTGVARNVHVVLGAFPSDAPAPTLIAI
jgi:hypothetical protein